MRTIRTTTISILAVGLLAGATVGAAAQDEEEAPVVSSFTGVWHPEGESLPGVEWTNVDLPNGFSEGKPGFAWRTRLVSSDPRFTGDFTTINNWVVDPAGFEEPWARGDQVNSIQSNWVELTNDGGSWLGESMGFASTSSDRAGMRDCRP